MNRAILNILGLSLLLSPVALLGQDEDHFIKPSDREYLSKQATSLYQPFQEPVREIAKSTVEVWVGKYFSGMGTVVEGGRVLTKFSELERGMRLKGDRIICRDGAGKVMRAKVTGAYFRYDLGVLTVDGLEAAAVAWEDEVSPVVGSFLGLAVPGGKVGSVGVVSVRPRSFLGIGTGALAKGDGVLVTEVRPKSAAEKAGLKVRDHILSIEGKKSGDPSELTGIMQSLEVGQEVTMNILRQGKPLSLDVVLDERLPEETLKNSRVKMMRRMGTEVSRRSEGFPSAMYSDMPIGPKLVGSPVVDSSGGVVGLVVARASRIRTTIIPSRTILQLLESEPQKVTIQSALPNGRAERGLRNSSRDVFDLFRRMLGE